jgi:alanyl-tRNA synthetase
MHPLIPFLLGEKHPQGKRLVGVQKCIRTGDIEDVGDEVHHTFFEMLGNWSLGDYWKKESLEFSYEFLTKILKVPNQKISVTCFKGEKNISKDIESEKIWKNIGINKIKFLGKEDNWWGPAGKTGPCGPDSEIFVNNTEIWNNVFMQYNKNKEGKYEPLKQKNVDTGMGVERTLAVLNGLNDNYLTDVWKPIIEKIEELSDRRYGQYEGVTRDMRIIADHIKASVFILNEGIIPSNTEQGYVLRRLIRRTIRYGKFINLKNFTDKIAESVFEIYDDYNLNKEKILNELKKEEEKFNKTLEKGLMILNKKIIEAVERKTKSLKGKPYTGLEKKDIKEISGKEVFLLYQSYGLPLELILEEAKKRRGNTKVDIKGFYDELKKHQQLSRISTEGKFKSGLADNSEATTKLHTAAHLLLAALQKVLKDENIIQKGSNITPERLRLDFSFSRKLREEEIKDIENLVNEQIKKQIPVIREEMNLEEARKKGAKGIFEDKYGKIVSIYTIGSFSKEICTGPHVKNTKELGKFKITKEESSSSGVRRIKAILK